MKLVLYSLVIFAPLLVQGSCPWNWSELNGSGACYKIINERMTWETAARRCASLHSNSELASIRNSIEFDAVQGFLYRSGAEQYWLGATDVQKEGTWRWTDGSLVTLNYWSGGSTDNWQGKEHCMSWWRISKKLNDMDCKGWSVPALCKIPERTTTPRPTPRPTCPPVTQCPVVTCPTSKPCPTVTPCPTTPLTIPPTTPAPTTLVPTTLPPTTLVPTTLPPTTLPPTTLVPTTESPRTPTTECQLVGYVYKGEEIEEKSKARNAKTCAKRCINSEDACVAWSYVSKDETIPRKQRKMCTLLKSVNSTEEANLVSSGYPSKCAFNC